MLLVAFRHGLRASELVGLRWEQIDFRRAIMHVRRVKGGTPSVHPVSGVELRALRRLQLVISHASRPPPFTAHRPPIIMYLISRNSSTP